MSVYLKTLSGGGVVTVYLLDELLLCHPISALHGWIVSIGVQHDGGEGQDVNGWWRWHPLHTVVFPLWLGIQQRLWVGVTEGERGGGYQQLAREVYLFSFFLT
jgi:hypothetical protein